MTKRYWYVILTYVLMQLSGYPVLYALMKMNVFSTRSELVTANVYWTIISFILALIITLLLLRPDMNMRKKYNWSKLITWAILGVFMALLAQGIASNIETNVFGVNPESENTQNIMRLVEVVPLLIAVVSIIGPILEEVVFRKIIFGSLYGRSNFFIAAIISSFIFALVHQDFSHLLVYMAMGLTFAFLYVKTSSILVPIFAHVSMNTFVVMMQYVFKDDIEKYIEQQEKLQQIFGGFQL
ncbi:CPBP family intramembrane glutamic endopeptidase [Priestia endophytica]|uniref:CPBP family intramembrane metalloprotease n=1 Tax=Priestia endophytica TaxID=135735 RepID=A0AAX1Q6K7_9BACI|nr:type II CAAX endopeptidase family protein [Priestia endophytica]RAS75735.1 CPBP family intramembrane metalloprotease [Priestia endophytica]RAS92490.1 CPBP family intramembrane metalloprotease [Priestia endophytica]